MKKYRVKIGDMSFTQKKLYHAKTSERVRRHREKAKMAKVQERGSGSPGTPNNIICVQSDEKMRILEIKV